MITPERIETAPARRLIGLNGSFTLDTRGEIPDLWNRWAYTTVTDVTRPDLVFGVSHSFRPPDGFDYMCALEVSDSATVPEGMTDLTLPAGDYAVFVHNGPVAGVSSIFDAVVGGGVPLDGYTYRAGPQLEVYGDGFDPQTASGRVEIWFPAQLA